MRSRASCSKVLSSEVLLADHLTLLLTEFDVLERFRRLAPAKQAGYVRWVDTSSTDETRAGRVQALVLALRIAGSL